MKILVMGAGAVGSVFGGLLAESGQAVSLIGRESYMQAVRDNGLRISGIWGEHLIRNIRTYTSAKEIDKADFDVILLTTKSFDTEAAVKEVLPLVGPKTLIVSLQNGIGNIETITSLAGKEHTLGGRVIFGIEFVAPGHFKVTVIADKVLLGTVSKDVPKERIVELAATITRAGVPTDTTDDINKFVWLKVLYNCCLNAPTALLDTIYGKLGEFEPTREIMSAVISEVLAVAKSRGIDMGFPTVAAYEEVFYGKLLPPTYAHHSSTLQDLKSGKKTEIEALNGAIVRLGKEKGVPAPVNWTLTQLIHAREELNKNPE
jgi:2-dehydropantoate 2-reductase